MAITEKQLADTKHWTPFQFSVFDPIQLFDAHNNIYGARISFAYGKNADICGIDLGLGINNAKNVTGIQLGGVFNNTADYPEHHSMKGIQIAGVGNTTDYLHGVQIGGFGNGVTLDAVGIQIGLIGNVASTIKGIQIAGLYNYNYARNSNVTGIQIGVFNYAENFVGLQIGLFNECKHIKGLQFGLINHIEEGQFEYLPIINVNF